MVLNAQCALLWKWDAIGGSRIGCMLKVGNAVMVSGLH